jgi:hypothetical protein
LVAREGGVVDGRVLAVGVSQTMGFGDVSKPRPPKPAASKRTPMKAPMTPETTLMGNATPMSLRYE